MAATTTLKLPDSLKKRIAPLADAEGKTPHAWMVDALEAQASLAERRKAFYGEARSRLTEFRQTGAAYRAAGDGGLLPAGRAGRHRAPRRISDRVGSVGRS
jgi:predicted transcriptional regulator